MGIHTQGEKISSLIDGLGFFVSRSGKLHRVSSIKEYGNYVKFITDCGQYIVVRNSRRSKAARWIRNGWMKSSCKRCKIKSGELSRFKICR